jgi:hypothetical protein
MLLVRHIGHDHLHHSLVDGIKPMEGDYLEQFDVFFGLYLLLM